VFRAFLTSNGTMTDLGTLGGDYSEGRAISNAGHVTGYSYTADANLHAFLYRDGTMTDLNTVAGVAGSGWTLFDARGVNDTLQITGTGSLGGQTSAYLLSLDTVVWEGGISGSWDDRNGWSFGVTPVSRMNVTIDPVRSLTVTGPSASASVRTLAIGGDATGNNGIATLSLDGGTISVLGSGGAFATISANGVLTGDGTINGAITNLGTVNAQNLTLSGGLTNQGLVNGDGRLNTGLINASSGLVQAGAGQTLRLSGASHSNAGQIEAIGGGNLVVTGTFANNSGGQLYVSDATVRFASAVTNATGGRIQSDDAVLRFNGGLTNSGQMQFTFGESAIFGNVTTTSGGKVILSGNSNTTFYDMVDIGGGGELLVSAGSAAVFFGRVVQRTGSTFSGSGVKFYVGGLAVGGSPGLGMDAGDVTFDSGNFYEAEIGGLVPGSGFDKYVVGGRLSFGGTLKLTSWQGFTGQAGHSYDLFDWGTTEGAFDTIDADGLVLASGTRLDVSRLYVDGTISIAAVPEPGEWAMLLAGLALVGGTARRRGRAPMARDDIGRAKP
jgi:probable HAF family extracellular repeat protein